MSNSPLTCLTLLEQTKRQIAAIRLAKFAEFKALYANEPVETTDCQDKEAPDAE